MKTENNATEVGTDQNPIRYHNDGATPEERKAIQAANLEKFSSDAQAGKVLCLSDLIGGAERVHMDNVEKGRAGK